MKCKTIIYINKDDPRNFVYKNEKWKWVGVTLNFAHPKSFLILLVTIISGMIPPVPLLAPIIWKGSFRIALTLTIIIFVIWLTLMIRYYYQMAAKEIKQYPGNLSVRE